MVGDEPVASFHNIQKCLTIWRQQTLIEEDVSIDIPQHKLCRTKGKRL
eukprot:XP_001706715.1 Hypothetical protein GL50803_37753 [Giardia lamblia ATCC 50803]